MTERMLRFVTLGRAPPQERVAAARKYVPDFGLAAYCGFGRTPPGELPRILADHLGALTTAGFA